MKLLQIYNFAAHYRSAIYQMIDKELNADFVIGDKVGDIRPMDYRQLSNQVTIVHNVHLLNVYWQRGVLKYIFKDYDTYLFTGEYRCVSTWVFLLFLRFAPHKRAFIWTHGWLGKETLIKRIITRLFFHLTDGIFVYNNRSRGLMIKGGVSPNKMVTIYNSLDYERQIVIRKELHPSSIYQDYFGNNRQVLIFIGRLTKVKRLDWIIDALQLLHHRGYYYNLVIIGDGEDRLFLEKQAEEKSISESVWFCGACYDEVRNAEYFYNADLCVSPGNVGLTAIHALMYGCPVITNDDYDHQMPEFEAIQQGITGDFFINGSVQSLAECIHHWMINNRDRESIRQACYAEIDKKWTPQNQIRILRNSLL